MRNQSFDTSYEPPISSSTFYMPTKPLFLFKPANRAFAEGQTRTLPPDWNVFISVLTAVVIGFIAAFTFVPQPLLVMNLNQRGQAAQATISGHYIQHGKSTTYHVQFSYSANEASYVVQQDVSADTYNKLAQGTHVTIRYLPDDPAQARLWGANADESNTQFYFFVIVGICLAVLIFGYFLVEYVLRTRRLAADGQLIDGTIVGANLRRSKSNYVLKLNYTFTSPTTGQPLTRSESSNRTDLKNSGTPSYGTPVKVLYLNDKTYRVL